MIEWMNEQTRFFFFSFFFSTHTYSAFTQNNPVNLLC